MSLSLIVAIAKNNAIGKDNDLLWHISNDLKHFKTLTSNHTVVMGRQTYLSLPFRPLPNRRNIVLTTRVGEHIEGCETAHSVQEAVELTSKDGEVFIMGGGSIYQQFLPIADTMYITWVDQDFEADIFFPEIEWKEWEEVERSQTFIDESNQLPYRFSTYKRIR